MKFCVILVLFITLLYNCVDPAHKRTIKQNMIDGEVAAFKIKKISDCQDRIAKEADRKVDTLLMNQALFNKIDSFLKPPKPIRPQMPPIKGAVDTTPLAPLLDSLHFE